MSIRPTVTDMFFFLFSGQSRFHWTQKKWPDEKVIGSDWAQNPFLSLCEMWYLPTLQNFFLLFFLFVCRWHKIKFLSVSSLSFIVAQTDNCLRLLTILYDTFFSANFTGNFISTNASKENKQSTKREFWAVAAGNYSPRSASVWTHFNIAIGTPEDFQTNSQKKQIS